MITLTEIAANKVREIAKEKFKDLNCADMEAAVKQIKGSARSMGIEVVEG